MDMKVCRKCDCLLPLEEFYRHPNNRDGHFSKCKPCVREYARGRYDVDVWREYRSAGHGKRSAEGCHNRWRMSNPEKIRAQRTFAYYIRKGKIKKGTHCSECYSTKYVEAHHEDYSKPLEVVWLCKSCHGLTRRIDEPLAV